MKILKLPDIFHLKNARIIYIVYIYIYIYRGYNCIMPALHDLGHEFTCHVLYWQILTK